jgi:type II secretory ATPase GspE/PulE/Tfp pilus assembly ATPase PilB-like protein
VLDAWQRQHAGRDGIVLYRNAGCDGCQGSGYLGRMGVYELLVADAAVKRLVQGRAPVVEVSAAAVAKGMRTLKQDGISKVLQGLTDLRQVRAM